MHEFIPIFTWKGAGLIPGKKYIILSFIEVANLPAGLYTNLYNTYVKGQGQVPGKKY